MTERRPDHLRRLLSLVLGAALIVSGTPSGVLAIQQPPPRPQPAMSKLQIKHDPLTCVTTSAGAAVDALVSPGPDVSVSRVLWRAAKSLPFYYYTVMTGNPPSLEGVIPRPEPVTAAVEYHLEAVDKASLTRNTPDYVAPVLDSRVCKDKGVVAGKDGLGLTIGLTDANQPPVPPGFRKEDIARVILVTGAVVTLSTAMSMMGTTGATGGAGAAGAGTGAASAGAGTAAGAGAAGAGAGAAAGAGAGAAAAAAGGISTGVLVGAGVVVAAGAGVAVAASSSKSKSTPTPVPPTPTPTPTVIAVRFLEADVTWSGNGDIDLEILNSLGQSVGQRAPGGCDTSGSSRIERVILQGTALTNGSYTIRYTGRGCAPPPPVTSTISAAITVYTDSTAKCPAQFVPIPTDNQPHPLSGCSITIP